MSGWITFMMTDGSIVGARTFGAWLLTALYLCVLLFASGYLFVGISSISWPRWLSGQTSVPEKSVA